MDRGMITIKLKFNAHILNGNEVLEGLGSATTVVHQGARTPDWLA